MPNRTNSKNIFLNTWWLFKPNCRFYKSLTSNILVDINSMKYILILRRHNLDVRVGNRGQRGPVINPSSFPNVLPLIGCMLVEKNREAEKLKCFVVVTLKYE